MESGTPGPPPPAPEAPEPAATAMSFASVPQVRPGAGPPSAPYPVITEFDRQDEYSRWLPFVKWLLALPHWFVLAFIWIGAFFAVLASWFMVLFTGKYPAGIHSFVTGTYRWTTRVAAYTLLMTDRYPPFSFDADDEYPARFDIAYTEQIARWRPLVHWLLVIPYAIVASVLMWLAYVISFIAFFTILFTKNFPAGMFDFNVVAMRWQNRSSAYYLWMTEKYPPFEWG
jgi:uncharacterized protein DUF4389